MMFLLRWALYALALYAVGRWIPGVTVDGYLAAIIGSAVLAIIHVCLKPILVLLSLPVTVLTLGFFLLIINALLFWFGAALAPGFAVASFAAAFWGALVFSVLSLIINAFSSDTV